MTVMLGMLFDIPQAMKEEEVEVILSLAKKTWFKNEPASEIDNWFNDLTVSKFVKTIQRGALDGFNLAPRLRRSLLISTCHLFSILTEADEGEDAAIQIIREQYKMVHYCDAQPDDSPRYLDPSVSGAHVVNGFRAAISQLEHTLEVSKAWHEADREDYRTPIEGKKARNIETVMRELPNCLGHNE
ncbi:hypothetical protein FHETE_8805 [Fusarium heterosporum]|uniref:Uncharacterized protein n=1 Tax=Fusarium heterosporum TaxID=42747 RepID=A0A8H5WJR8_FUSHE|nr:hypothetical protein FHETE_8805 [Fusarium heterosporum]